MVSEVLPHAGQGVAHRDARCAQVRRIAHARQLQQVRRADRTCRDNHLARRMQRMRLPVPFETDTSAARAIEHQARDQGAGLEPQVRTLQCRAQIRLPRVPAEAAITIDLHVGHAILAAAVAIRVERKAGLLRGLHEGVREGQDGETRTACQWTAAAAQRGLHRILRRILHRRLPVLALAQVQQHLPPGPAIASGGGPIVVIEGIATHVQAAVDGAGAAHHAAARPGQAPAAGRGMGFGTEVPVQPGMVDQVAHPGRNPDQRIRAVRTGFEQHHLSAALGQARRENAARRSRADDDVIGDRSAGVARGSRRGHGCAPGQVASPVPPTPP